MENQGLPDAGASEKAKDSGSMRAYCKEYIHFRYCIERTRDIPCSSFRKKEGKKRDERNDSRTTGAAADRLEEDKPDSGGEAEKADQWS